MLFNFPLKNQETEFTSAIMNTRNKRIKKKNLWGYTNTLEYGIGEKELQVLTIHKIKTNGTYDKIDMNQ